MNAQEQVWSNDFGNNYTARNRVNWWARVPFWARIISETRPRSVLELGCNAGWNLMAIRALGFPMTLRGLDINAQAVAQAIEAGFNVEIGSVINEEADLVCTAGMLIHVSPDHLMQTMQNIVDHAKRYVLAIEYEHGFEQEIEYRGTRGLLWKQPYGSKYQGLGLRLVDQHQVSADDGFDRCTAWLLEKP